MSEKEKPRIPNEHPGPGCGPPGSDNLLRIRSEAKRLAQAGSDAIEKALSSDSASFNKQIMQQGGE
jgi:hypothetical protein